MLQIRRNDPSRRRRIKRDLATISKKGMNNCNNLWDLSNIRLICAGIAGLRTEGESHQPSEQIEVHRSLGTAEGHSAGLMPLTPSNTPQTPTSGRESPNPEELESTINRIQSLQLDNENVEVTTEGVSNNSQQRSDENNSQTRSTRYNLRYRSMD